MSDRFGRIIDVKHVYRLRRKQRADEASGQGSVEFCRISCARLRRLSRKK
jgi:hypothetical protein